MKAKISPSLLAADFLHLEDDVKRTEVSGADMLHCDVMDGVYVPNISFGFSIIKQVGSVTNLPLDVHMMTSCPEKYLEVLKDANASIVTVHSDYADKETVIETLRKIRELGMSPAVSLKPKCPASDAYPFVPYVDMILVMTVEPGFGGQKFMSDMMPKVRELREYLDRHAPDISIEVDGGIGRATIREAAEAGADIFVVGTGLYKASDMKEEVVLLKDLAEHGK